MPIVVRCPNGACNQPLQVPDQYAGMQGKCPQCGTLVTFPAAGTAPPPPPAPAAPGVGTYAMAPPPPPPATPQTAAYVAAPAAPAAYPAAAPAAYPPAAPTAYVPPPAAAGYPAAPPAPARPPLTTEQLIDLIALPAGLFFLFLLFIATLLPWSSLGSGVKLGDAGIFLVLCLLVGAAGGLTYLLKPILTRVVAVAAGFGTFSFFVMLGAMMEYSGATGAGVWVGLLAAMGVAGAFITLSLYRPVQSPVIDSLNVSPFLKRHAALFLAIALGVGLGFFYLLFSIMFRKAALFVP